MIQKAHKRPKVEVNSYKGKRFTGLMKAVFVLVLTGAAVFALLLGQVLGGARDDINGDPKVMVILGCQLYDWGPSIMLQDRLDKALEYLYGHPDMLVVVSGGQGENEPTTEAQGMADYLADHGFSRENIILETQSHNTNQNLRWSAQHLEEAGFDIKDGVVIVSNGFHLTRAKMLAGRAGFENVSTLAAPSSHLPSRLKMYIREPLALVKSFVFDR
ncbi:YdcF family protein [Flintibacter muris]|uniref:YdcF family protein n=1 Tax=Flintibacter muris TaxID=2941327 RepID=UPI00203CBFFD|nr:YdcF family protein [Flintibacter muris]